MALKSIYFRVLGYELWSCFGQVIQYNFVFCGLDIGIEKLKQIFESLLVACKCIFRALGSCYDFLWKPVDTFLRVQWFYGPPEPVWIRPSTYYPPLPPLPSVPGSSRVYVKEGEPPRTYYRVYPKVQTVVERPPQHKPPEESRARVVEGGGPPVVVKELVKTPPAISFKNLVGFFFSLGLSPYEEKPPLLWLLVLLFCFLVHHLWVCVCLSLLLLISHFFWNRIWFKSFLCSLQVWETNSRVVQII